MPTIINNPAQSSEFGGYSFLFGIIALIIFVLLFVYYAVPALRRMGPAQINVPTEINVPDKVDVNVEQQ